MDLKGQLEMAFFENNKQEALQLSRKVIETFDYDDDDDLEALKDILDRGLRSEFAADFVSLLEAMNFDFSVKLPECGGILVLAADSFHLNAALLKQLRACGALLEARDRQQRNFLHHLTGREKSFWFTDWDKQGAAAILELENLQELLNADVYGATPLHLAAVQDYPEMTAALLARGADPNVTGTICSGSFAHTLKFDQRTPLMLACSLGRDELVSVLLKHGADVSVKDPQGRTARHYAADIPNSLYCKDVDSPVTHLHERRLTLLRQLAYAEDRDERGKTPLLTALENWKFDRGDYTALFLALGADPNAADNAGTAPLMAAARSRSKEAVKLLIKAGAELNARDSQGRTALHLALSEGDEKLGRLLIKKGADVQLVDNDGVSAVQLAAEKGMESVMELIIG